MNDHPAGATQKYIAEKAYRIILEATERDALVINAFINGLFFSKKK